MKEIATILTIPPDAHIETQEIVASSEQKVEIVGLTAQEVASIMGPYDNYWDKFRNLPISRAVARQAELNSRKLHQLDNIMLSPPEDAEGQYSTQIKLQKKSVEWYLSLGSFNRLNGASGRLLHAAARMWSYNTTENNNDPNIIVSRFMAEVGSAKDEKIPERINEALFDQDYLSSLSLSGQAMLDAVRSGNIEKQSQQKSVLNVAYAINHKIATCLGRLPELTRGQSRILSDTLKFKHEIKYEFLLLNLSST